MGTELNTMQAELSQNDAQALIVYIEFPKRKLESGATDFSARRNSPAGT